MNRKQRRAALKNEPPVGRRGDSPDRQVSRLLAEAAGHEQVRKFEDAARAYKRALSLDPDNAQACNNFARLLQAQGKNREASIYFARTLELMPQLLQQYESIRATLVALLPALDEALRRQAAAWPQHLTPAQLSDSDFTSITEDPLFLQLLKSIPVHDVALERLLTSLRKSLLIAGTSGKNGDERNLAFACALAQQCFINEYVFATTPEEDELVSKLAGMLGSSEQASAMEVAIVAMYRPLSALDAGPSLTARSWPQPVEALLNLQLQGPAEERALRDLIPRLTPIGDDVSVKVRKQYEENPYPRWIYAAAHVTPKSIDQYLREQFPTSPFTPLGKTEKLDVLVAGCGTGYFAVASTQRYLGAQVLAVDLSLSSLAYARRNTPQAVAARIDYAQADILNLATVGRSFDIIDASGVLHHMADPFEAWRILLSLVRPGGLMHLGFYSEAGRGDVVAARQFIAQHGFGTTPVEIRRCRQELLKTPLASVSRFNDFFSTSECRDLLFNVQEARIDIPAIKKFISAQGVRFLGFEFDLAILQRYRAQFAAMGWSLSDLDRWHAIEVERPDTFSGMYQFWIQKV